MKAIYCKTGEKVKTYQEYISTTHWKNVQDDFAHQFEKACFMCESPYRIELLHITYENLGHEVMEDLMYVCKKCENDLYNQVDTILVSILGELKPIIKMHLRGSLHSSVQSKDERKVPKNMKNTSFLKLNAFFDAAYSRLFFETIYLTSPNRKVFNEHKKMNIKVIDIHPHILIHIKQGKKSVGTYRIKEQTTK